MIHTSAATSGIAQRRPVARPVITPPTTHSRPRLPERRVRDHDAIEHPLPDGGHPALRAESGAAAARHDAHGVDDVLDAQPDAALVVLDVDRARALGESGLDAGPILRCSPRPRPNPPPRNPSSNLTLSSAITPPLPSSPAPARSARRRATRGARMPRHRRCPSAACSSISTAPAARSRASSRGEIVDAEREMVHALAAPREKAARPACRPRAGRAARCGRRRRAAARAPRRPAPRRARDASTRAP